MKKKIDSIENKKERRALSIVDYKFTRNGKWIYRRESGQDYGCDCSLELVSGDDSLEGKKAFCQVKGRSDICYLNSKGVISFALESSTFNMAIEANYLFLLILVDLVNEKVYFLKLNGYGAFTENETTVNVHIPMENLFPNNDMKLIEYFNAK